jgi:preprotein translocase subunit SecD
MRLSLRSLAVAIVSVAALLAASCSRDQEKAADQPKASLEFRRAEMEPGEGLTEASVPGWQDPIYLHATADVTAADVAVARVVLENPDPNPWVELIFTADASRKMATVTEEHRGKRFAILLNGRVVSAPAVLARVSGRVQITGAFTRADADRLVSSINTK